jgi:hypothetical protein
MIRVRVQETRLFTNLNPTEVALVASQLEHQLNDRFDPKAIRARKKWRETVDIEVGSGTSRYFCNCKLKDDQDEECVVHVTGITKTQGRRASAKPA